ncbi:protein fucoxanthin chlorophyll a/c protein [Phaeodactylum tricornutum CCAP 1055/1]|uniref:Protein fucoxanthin chlorophyll a/c protein n=1 Tax=Phaeodactylum tricornutum (strain CCAP 1055/1) TaxID=556484 RepID=B7FQS0_PHATC|nr:protein fucoxanthin chlorophyll a/c protein [Phaeodactylum tricornutum CCAP 1055/1]EEC51380.1 protein fucoxanthin chlorophyll a/c protein [Phaeodactylum tricornutum CCAP 1055/1]|eukprot:XP_002176917.1 protein fucoxanthin chlorophyll a/c protein [Phaeodactylum tricornutum CCAP 1055/1]
MKFCLAIASFAASASAFAPSPQNSQNSRTQTSLNNDLWGQPPSDGKEKSKALPFANRPKLLDGSMPGDVGFDPFGFAGADKASLMYMREAEIKHCRLAMLAVAGWVFAELFDKPIADAVGLPTALTKSGASPSILNGGLEKIDIAYWLAVVTLAGIVEIENSKVKEDKGKDYILGDCGFDPIGLYPKEKSEQFAMQTKELKNGRLAMMAKHSYLGLA